MYLLVRKDQKHLVSSRIPIPIVLEFSRETRCSVPRQDLGDLLCATYSFVLLSTNHSWKRHFFPKDCLWCGLLFASNGEFCKLFLQTLGDGNTQKPTFRTYTIEQVVESLQHVSSLSANYESLLCILYNKQFLSPYRLFELCQNWPSSTSSKQSYLFSKLFVVLHFAKYLFPQRFPFLASLSLSFVALLLSTYPFPVLAQLEEMLLPLQLFIFSNIFEKSSFSPPCIFFLEFQLVAFSFPRCKSL